MFKIEIGGKEYQVKYGVNSFADTDLMDRTQWIIDQMSGEKEPEDQAKMLREMVITLRELLYVGFKKENPIDDIEVVGDMLDDYIDEHSEDADVIMNLFGQIAEELMAKGFLADLLKTADSQKQVKKPKRVK